MNILNPVVILKQLALSFDSETIYCCHKHFLAKDE